MEETEQSAAVGLRPAWQQKYRARAEGRERGRGGGGAWDSSRQRRVVRVPTWPDADGRAWRAI